MLKIRVGLIVELFHIRTLKVYHQKTDQQATKVFLISSCVFRGFPIINLVIRDPVTKVWPVLNKSSRCAQVARNVKIGIHPHGDDHLV